MAKKLFLVVLSSVLGLSLLLSSCSLVNKINGNNIATVGSNDIYVSPGVFTSWDYAIFVNLKPTQSAIAGETYNVDLYEKGTFRATTTVSFTQPDIGSTEKVAFPATADEENAYFGKNISNIFSVKVYDSNTITTSAELIATQSVLINSNQPSSLTLTSPNGGEVWHVGETVNITWKTTNMNQNVSIAIELYTDYDHHNIALVIPVEATNTGIYQWTIPSTIEYQSVVGSDERIKLMANGGGIGIVLTSISISDFTILPN
jgi:hypothetical protein